MFFDFIEQYFVNPNPAYAAYNWVSTPILAVLFIATILIIYYLFLKPLKIKIDGKFALALSPYILLGSILRVLRDSEFFYSIIFVTPWIYLMVFLVSAASILISLYANKFFKANFHSTFFSIGFTLSGIFFIQMNLVNITAFLQVFFIDGLIFILLFGFGKFFEITKSLWNRTVIFSQLFDATSTFVALQFWGFGEQHVATNLLFELAGNFWIFFVAKFFVALLLIYAVEKYIEDENFRNWIKIVVIFLGFGLGLRDLFQIIILS